MHKTLSALVIHDLKNSLALLEIDLEQLNHHDDAPPEGRRAYRRCVELKNRLISFLTLYKFEQSGLNPMMTEVDLGDFIEDLVSNSQSVMAAAHHGHEITVRVASERMPPVDEVFSFDENMVEMALESALNNAIRYAHHKVELWLELTGDTLIFKVQDDGVGVIVAEELVQRDIPEQSSSTGLGLELCKAVAQVHGKGSVRLESMPGGGTLFSMELHGER